MSKNPYYIIAPKYTRTSAGIRVLYRMADMINKSGGSAFIFLSPYYNKDLASSPMDVAPFLTKKIVDYHFKNSLVPIVIYPETVDVEKYNPPIRVQYLLNFDGYLNKGKHQNFEADDFLLFYSNSIAAKCNLNRPYQVLNLPISDPNFFKPPSSKVVRKGSVFYAAKYKYTFGGELFSITDNMIEITRDLSDSQSQEEIRELLQRSEYFYTYEDTSLVIEAILCECPVVMIPNAHFSYSLGVDELDALGIAWGYEPDQLEHAKNTVSNARDLFLSKLTKLNIQIDEFINETQKLALNKKYEIPFANGSLKFPSFFIISVDFFIFIIDIIKQRGLIDVLYTIAKRIVHGRVKY